MLKSRFLKGLFINAPLIINITLLAEHGFGQSMTKRPRADAC
jgi:hypothetical protein